ncbi:uncharacterized protein MKK02DRAFT_31227 [Dioszegia hungarica]|uniref:Uncharacterized protein n=1 Tax=Dioszegia hungarica TaxID=4972 RepID=A0AA38HH59_9TREE|nr:uncharacterized protein MKK02DRAFT_31227 [Dioszegia hungarica]KAI9638949.1 hypothetical protein MKK02DRAFT_31227 [Dioszegia hungarica]
MFDNNNDNTSNFSYGSGAPDTSPGTSLAQSPPSRDNEFQNFMFGNYGINTLSVTPEPASPPVSPGTVTPYTAPSVYPSYYQDDDLSSAPFATAFVPGWQDGYVPPAPSAYVPVADSFGYNAPSSYSGHVYPSVFQSDDLTPVVPPSPTPSIDFADPIWSIRPTADDHSWSYIDPRLLQPVPVASPFSVSDDSLQTVIVAKVPGTSRSVPVSVADSSEDEVESTGNTTVVEQRHDGSVIITQQGHRHPNGCDACAPGPRGRGVPCMVHPDFPKCARCTAWGKFCSLNYKVSGGGGGGNDDTPWTIYSNNVMSGAGVDHKFASATTCSTARVGRVRAGSGRAGGSECRGARVVLLIDDDNGAVAYR